MADTLLITAIATAGIGAVSSLVRTASLQNRISEMTRYNGKTGTYLKGDKTVHIHCLTTYVNKGVTYCVVENASQQGTTVYSVPLSKITFD